MQNSQVPSETVAQSNSSTAAATQTSTNSSNAGKTLSGCFNIAVPFGLAGLFVLYMMMAGMAGGSSLTNEVYITPLFEMIWSSVFVWFLILLAIGGVGFINIGLIAKNRNAEAFVLTIADVIFFVFNCVMIFNVVSS